jgi:hypothetical protein
MFSRRKPDAFAAVHARKWDEVVAATSSANVNATDSTASQATLLHWVASEGHLPTLEHLLKCGADVAATDAG